MPPRTTATIRDPDEDPEDTAEPSDDEADELERKHAETVAENERLKSELAREQAAKQRVPRVVKRAGGFAGQTNQPADGKETFPPEMYLLIPAVIDYLERKGVPASDVWFQVVQKFPRDPEEKFKRDRFQFDLVANANDPCRALDDLIIEHYHQFIEGPANYRIMLFFTVTRAREMGLPGVQLAQSKSEPFDDIQLIRRQRTWLAAKEKAVASGAGSPPLPSIEPEPWEPPPEEPVVAAPPRRPQPIAPAVTLAAPEGFGAPPNPNLAVCVVCAGKVARTAPACPHCGNPATPVPAFGAPAPAVAHSPPPVDSPPSQQFLIDLVNQSREREAKLQAELLSAIRENRVPVVSAETMASTPPAVASAIPQVAPGLGAVQSQIAALEQRLTALVSQPKDPNSTTSKIEKMIEAFTAAGIEAVGQRLKDGAETILTGSPGEAAEPPAAPLAPVAPPDDGLPYVRHEGQSEWGDKRKVIIATPKPGEKSFLGFSPMGMVAENPIIAEAAMGWMKELATAGAEALKRVGQGPTIMRQPAPAPLPAQTANGAEVYAAGTPWKTGGL